MSKKELALIQSLTALENAFNVLKGKQAGAVSHTQGVSYDYYSYEISTIDKQLVYTKAILYDILLDETERDDER